MTPYPDLSHRYGEEDEFDLEGYAEMSIQDRSRSAIVRHSDRRRSAFGVKRRVSGRNNELRLILLIRDLEDGDLAEGKNEWYVNRTLA